MGEEILGLVVLMDGWIEGCVVDVRLGEGP